MSIAVQVKPVYDASSEIEQPKSHISDKYMHPTKFENRLSSLTSHEKHDGEHCIAMSNTIHQYKKQEKSKEPSQTS